MLRQAAGSWLHAHAAKLLWRAADAASVCQNNSEGRT
jgi:hypothetical protein